MNEIVNYNVSFNNATEAFEYWYDQIMKNGLDTANGTKALYNVCFVIRNPKDRVITTPWRKFNDSYAKQEWEWYQSGWPYVTEIKKVAKIWDRMHGGDDRVNSNYGWQWKRNNQLDKCIEQLRNNPNSRQAWISIYDGKEKDNYQFDTPCTMCVGFDIKNGKLDMTVVMRSNDLVYGFCNDQYCFSMLQEYVANELNIEIGTYTHIAHDLHIYERHYDMKTKYENNGATK